jgi:hypothetical protein
MMLDVTEQPRNKKALQKSKQRARTNKKKAKLKKHGHKIHRR